MKTTLAVLALVTICPPFNLQNAPDAHRDVVGQVLEVRGNVYLKANAAAKSIKLDTVHDRNRPLYAGELVRCDPGGVLRVIVNRKEEVIAPSKDWRTFSSQAGDELPNLNRNAIGPGSGKEEIHAHLEATEANARRLAGQIAELKAIDPDVRTSDTAPTVIINGTATLTADQVLERYAIAGAVSHELKSQSTEVSGGLEVPELAMNGSLHAYTKSPGKALVTIEFPGSAVIREGTNGKSAWLHTSGHDAVDLDGSQSWLTRLTSGFYSAKRLTTEYSDWKVLNEVTMGYHRAYLLEGRRLGGPPEKFYFDVLTGLLIRVDSVVGTGGQSNFKVDIVFDDYRDIGGDKIPFSTRIWGTGVSYIIKLKEFRRDVVLDDSKFEKPKIQ